MGDPEVIESPKIHDRSSKGITVAGGVITSGERSRFIHHPTPGGTGAENRHTRNLVKPARDGQGNISIDMYRVIDTRVSLMSVL